MYSIKTRVRYSECNNKGEASAVAVVNYMQDCCTFQSEDLNIGMDHLKKLNAFWVLSSWQIDILRFPKLLENITIGTIPYEIKGLFGLRNFVIREESGQAIIKANSVWALLNLENGRPVRAPEELCTAYPSEGKIDMEYLPRKLEAFEKGEICLRQQVTESFLDTNRHVNNAKYIMLSAECLPEDMNICRIRAEYKKPARLNDRIEVAMTKLENGYGCLLQNEAGEEYAKVIYYGGRK